MFCFALLTRNGDIITYVSGGMISGGILPISKNDGRGFPTMGGVFPEDAVKNFYRVESVLWECAKCKDGDSFRARLIFHRGFSPWSIKSGWTTTLFIGRKQWCRVPSSVFCLSLLGLLWEMAREVYFVSFFWRPMFYDVLAGNLRHCLVDYRCTFVCPHERSAQRRANVRNRSIHSQGLKTSERAAWRRTLVTLNKPSNGVSLRTNAGCAIRRKIWATGITSHTHLSLYIALSCNRTLCPFYQNGKVLASIIYSICRLLLIRRRYFELRIEIPTFQRSSTELRTRKWTRGKTTNQNLQSDSNIILSHEGYLLVVSFFNIVLGQNSV